VRNQTFKAGEHKDLLSPLRAVTPEERRIVQLILDALHARFVGVVRESRPRLDVSRLAELTDGRIFDAPQAIQAGLIDQIGDLHAAIDAAKAAAHVDEARVVAYRRPDETRENIYSASRGLPAQVNVLPVALGAVATSASTRSRQAHTRRNSSTRLPDCGAKRRNHTCWKHAASARLASAPRR